MSWSNLVRALLHPVPGTIVTVYHSHVFPGEGIINCNLTNVQRIPRLVSKAIQGTERGNKFL